MAHLALYPGSFDPFTLGHLDIARRALRLFDAVEIVVAIHPGKTSFMPAGERVALIREAAMGIENLSVDSLAGLVAPYARMRGATALVRGIRTACDFGAEARMAMANSQLCPGLETVYLLTAPAHAHTSSSLVRDTARWGGNLAPFVPPVVATALHARFSSKR